MLEIVSNPHNNIYTVDMYLSKRFTSEILKNSVYDMDRSWWATMRVSDKIQTFNTQYRVINSFGRRYMSKLA